MVSYDSLCSRYIIGDSDYCCARAQSSLWPIVTRENVPHAKIIAPIHNSCLGSPRPLLCFVFCSHKSWALCNATPFLYPLLVRLLPSHHFPSWFIQSSNMDGPKNAPADRISIVFGPKGFFGYDVTKWIGNGLLRGRGPDALFYIYLPQQTNTEESRMYNLVFLNAWSHCQLVAAVTDVKDGRWVLQCNRCRAAMYHYGRDIGPPFGMTLKFTEQGRWAVDCSLGNAIHCCVEFGVNQLHQHPELAGWAAPAAGGHPPAVAGPNLGQHGTASAVAQDTLVERTEHTAASGAVEPVRGGRPLLGPFAGPNLRQPGTASAMAQDRPVVETEHTAASDDCTMDPESANATNQTLHDAPNAWDAADALLMLYRAC